MKRFRILLLICFFFLFFYSSSFALNIVVSNSPLKKIIEQIAPQYVIYQIQPNGADFHSFEPTFSQWERIVKADLVIIVGTENWANKVYILRKNRPILSLAEGEHRFIDPHLWFDLKRVRELVKNFLDYIKKKDPKNYKKCVKRADIFLKELKKISKDYKLLSRCKYKEIFILGHPVFSYLLRGTGIKQITLIKGYNKEGEPSIKRLSEIIKGVQKRKKKIVFLVDPEFSRYKVYFEKHGIKVIKLWSGGSYYMKGSYLELLGYNLENIKKSLVCNF